MSGKETLKRFCVTFSSGAKQVVALLYSLPINCDEYLATRPPTSQYILDHLDYLLLLLLEFERRFGCTGSSHKSWQDREPEKARHSGQAATNEPRYSNFTAKAICQAQHYVVLLQGSSSDSLALGCLPSQPHRHRPFNPSTYST